MKTTPRIKPLKIGQKHRTRGAAIGGVANLAKSGMPFLPAARGPRPNTFLKTSR